MFVCHFPDLQKVQGHVITKFRNIQKLFFQVKRINDFFQMKCISTFNQMCGDGLIRD